MHAATAAMKRMTALRVIMPGWMGGKCFFFWRKFDHQVRKTKRRRKKVVEEATEVEGCHFGGVVSATIYRHMKSKHQLQCHEIICGTITKIHKKAPTKNSNRTHFYCAATTNRLPCSCRWWSSNYHSWPNPQ